MRLNRVIDDSAHREHLGLSARRVDGRMAAARLMAAECERMLERARGRLVAWLVEQACSRWAGPGVLFAPAMGDNGAALVGPCVVGDQADMIAAFALAGRLGWAGPWRALVGDRLEFLMARARRGDGFFVHALGLEGAVVEEVAQGSDQAAVARALVLGGRVLGWSEVTAMGADLRARMARAGMAEAGRDGVFAQHAQAVLDGMARWRQLGKVADVRAVLTGVAGLEAALEGALPGLWQGRDGAVAGGDLWCFARAAGALTGEDRIWLCP